MLVLEKVIIMRRLILSVCLILGSVGAYAGTPVTGDVNNDGAVTAADVTCLYDIMLGNSLQYLQRADVNAIANQPQQNAQKKKGDNGGQAQQQAQGSGKKNKKQKNQPKQAPVQPEVSDEEVAKQVRETLARLTSKGSKMGKGAKYRREKREAIRQGMEEELAKYKEAKIYCMGQIGKHYLEAKGIAIDTEFNFVVQNPNLSRARSITETLVDDFLKHRVDEVVMVYTRMENAMTEVAEVRQLLPLVRGSFIDDKVKNLPVDIPMETISFVPSPEEVMSRIAPEYVIGFVYGALVQSFCCEQNARMTAMQAATDAGDKMLKSLSTEYNRARQAAITQEITEIVAGARAQAEST